MRFVFPRTKFVDENGLMGQLIHIESEVQEAWKAAQSPDLLHTAEEIMDAYHSLETGLRILQEKYGVDLDAVEAIVKSKNYGRDYYYEGA